MTELVSEALALWGLESAEFTFVTGRENQVYRVTTQAGDFALRIRRPGLRSDAELLSELQWLDAMDHAGLSVPRPHPSLSGALLETVGRRRVDMVGWLSGRPLGRTRVPLDIKAPETVFHNLGREMARLHLACDAWQRPNGFTRCHWDAEGLLGDAPLWGRFWENPTLDQPTRSLLERFRDEARQVLDVKAAGLDYGLIHADLIRDNVIVDGPVIRMLDFDDGGFGFRLYDIATALIKNLSEPNFNDLKAALIAGYRDLRPLDTTLLDLFLGLRAVAYIGWIVPRMEEDGSPVRNARFIKDAQDLCSAWLAQTATYEGG